MPHGSEFMAISLGNAKPLRSTSEWLGSTLNLIGQGHSTRVDIHTVSRPNDWLLMFHTAPPAQYEQPIV